MKAGKVALRVVAPILAMMASTWLAACGPDHLDRLDLLRRFSGEQHGSREVFSFYFVSDRADVDGRPGYEVNGRQVGDALRWGVFEAAVDPQLTLGMGTIFGLLGASDDVVLRDVSEHREEELLDKIAADVAASSNKSLLVVLWGFKERFDTGALKTAYFTYLLDVDTPILLFDWPGNQGSSVLGYRTARGTTASSAGNLAAVLRRISDRVKPERLWLTASSLGCQVVCDAFSELAQDARFADVEPELEHVLLAAPDVAEGRFDEQFRNEFAGLTRRLTVYVAANDRALRLSEWITGTRRLGQSSRRLPSQLDEAIALLNLDNDDETFLHVVDVTAVNRTRNRHHYFTDSADYFDDFFARLLGRPPYISRRLYSVRYDADTTFSVLVPAD